MGTGTAAIPRCDPIVNLPRRGFVLLVLLTVFWGVNWPIIKVALEDIPVLTFRATCIFFAGLTILGLHLAARRSIRVPRHQWRALLLSGVLNITLWHTATGFGVNNTSSGRAAIIAYTMPIWAVPIGYLVLGDRPGWRRLTSLVLGTAGLAVLLVTDIQALGSAPLGPLLMLAGAVIWAGGTLAQKRVKWEVSSMVLIGWQCMICGIPIFVAAGVLDAGEIRMPGLWPGLALAYNTFIPFIICYYAYYEVVRIFPVGVATIGTLTIPIVGLFTGALMLGERLGWAEFTALGLVVAALAVPIVTRPENFAVHAK